MGGNAVKTVISARTEASAVTGMCPVPLFAG